MTAREIFEKALKGKYAIGAFNVANLETLKAVVMAGKKLNSPLLIEASSGEIGFFGIKNLFDVVENYKKELDIPIMINLDHSTDFDACILAIDTGYKYVHFDGGKMPYDENVKIVSEIVSYAHKQDVIVEGEFNHIEGSSEDHTTEDPENYLKDATFTDPKLAKDFVSKTKVDTLASFIGNLHGVYKSQKSLKLDLLAQIKEAIPNTFLSLHGSSGCVTEHVKKAIEIGVIKVNVNSEMRIAYKFSLIEELQKTPEIAAYKYTKPVIEAVQKIVESKILLFGSNNKA